MTAVRPGQRGTGVPRRAMVLAAGLGLRMRPLTDSRPKPLIEVAGRSLLDRVLDQLQAAGISDIVVNAHYLAGRIEAHVAARTPGPAGIAVSVEAERLETGGGVAKALPLLGDEPFFVVNGDVLWQDGPRPTLTSLAEAWNGAAMDALLLLHPTATAFGYDGAGDFAIAADGRLSRPADGAGAPYLFAGIQILSPAVWTGLPAPPFSLNWIYDRAAAAGRLFGLVHAGSWFHVGTPEDLALAEAELARRGDPAAVS
jgi:MurNAc alpha-1-phosphate uridylyltransferase